MDDPSVMRCAVCRQGRTEPGTTTVTLEQDGVTLVVRGVPARVCENCGEEYLDEREAEHLHRLAMEVERAGVRLEVRDFVAA